MHAYAAPYPLKGALARFTNFKFSINLCAGSPACTAYGRQAFRGKQGLSESIVKSDSV